MCQKVSCNHSFNLNVGIYFDTAQYLDVTLSHSAVLELFLIDKSRQNEENDISLRIIFNDISI